MRNLRLALTCLLALLIMASMGLLPHAAAEPVTVVGQRSVLVIPVIFSDRANSKSVADLQTTFNELKAYWSTVSYGKFTLEGTVLGKWYKLQENYGAFAGASADVRPLVTETLSLVRAELTLDAYSYIMIVHAGDDATRHLPVNNSDIYNYAGEDNGQGIATIAELDPVGPWAHQLGMAMGLPQLYNFDRSQWTCPYCDNFLAEWDLMAHGFWAGNGTKPVEPTSWVRMKLGWLNSSQIMSISPTSSELVTVNPLENGAGVVTVKIPLSNSQYYLLEVRERIGLDTNLPNEGVLIYIINDQLGSGQGPVRVVGTNPSEPNNAARSVGQTFTGEAGTSFTVVRKSYNGSYLVGFGPAYSQLYSVNIVLPLEGMNIIFDDQQFQADQHRTAHVTGVIIGTHQIQTGNTTDFNNGTRLMFQSWSDGTKTPKISITVNENLTLTALYATQYMLRISSSVQPSEITGGGWYDAGSTATVTMQGTFVQVTGQERMRFLTWVGDINSTSPTITLQMNTPHTITAMWRPQYFISTQTPYGAVQGGGWYDQGSTVMITVSPGAETNNSTRRIFAHWNGAPGGDASSPSIQLYVDGPRTITAVWTTLYFTKIMPTDSNGTILETPIPLYMLKSNGQLITVDNGTIWLPQGMWTVNYVSWHGVDITPKSENYTAEAPGTWTVRLLVYPLEVSVSDTVTNIPLSNVKVAFTFLNGEIVEVQTDNHGVAEIQQAPPGVYSVSVTGPMRAVTQLINLEGLQPPLNVRIVGLPTIAASSGLIILVGLIFFGMYRFRRTRANRVPQPEDVQ